MRTIPRRLVYALTLVYGAAIAGEAPSDKQVCAAGIAAMMGRDPKTVRTDRVDGNVFFQSYVRSSDKTTWRYKCQIEGQRIMWGSIDGRWRRHEMDEVLTFAWSTDKLAILEKGFNESQPRTLKTFTLAQLPRER